MFAVVSKFQIMRNPIPTLAFILITLSLAAQSAVAQTEGTPTPTVPPASAEAGKDVVHQLNSAFTRVFEIIAPTVVIIEVTKKSDASDGSSLDDLFFQDQPDEDSPRTSPSKFTTSPK